MSVVTRFPPSPTGFMHIGNARTALFNWLFARHHGGKFLVRIEDTDRKRHSEEAVEAILNGLEWLGLDYDGEVVSQFSRMKNHAAIAHKLVEDGKAYYCYCTEEELDEMRVRAREEKLPTFYNRRWRDETPDNAPENIRPTIRIKAPLTGSTTIKDHVQGEVTIANDHLDDFIILRSDGTPTYMLSVVVDDHDMGITHVIRGDDHLNNTFRQKIIYDAMGWDVPEFAHLPLIHGPDGAKFSKRHGAQSVEEYRQMGYLPEAMCNYLLRLGWSHGDDEIIPRDQAIEWFDMNGLGKSASRFDFTKLESVNAHYMKEIDGHRLIEIAKPFYKERHKLDLDDQAVSRILAGQDELKSRAKTVLQFVDESAFYAKTVPFAYDEKAKDLILGHQDILQAIQTGLKTLDDFTSDSIQKLCKSIADQMADGKLGKIAMPLRAALTGTTVSPSVFQAAEILGKAETLLRLDTALKQDEKADKLSVGN